MTIDPETKKYVDSLITQFSINMSALITAITNTLEEKGVFTRDDFMSLIEKSRNIRNQAALLSGTSIKDFKTNISNLEELANKLQKESIEGRKNWEDLK